MKRKTVIQLSSDPSDDHCVEVEVLKFSAATTVVIIIRRDMICEIVQPHHRCDQVKTDSSGWSFSANGSDYVFNAVGAEAAEVATYLQQLKLRQLDQWAAALEVLKYCSLDAYYLINGGRIATARSIQGARESSRRVSIKREITARA